MNQYPFRVVGGEVLSDESDFVKPLLCYIVFVEFAGALLKNKRSDFVVSIIAYRST